MALLFNGRWASASEAVDQLVAIAGPSFALTDKANVQMFLGRPREALATLGGTTEVNKNWENYMACHAHLLLGDARAAIGECEKAIGRDPHVWSAHLFLAAARAQVGELEAARASLAEVERMSPGHTVLRLRSYRYAAHPEYQRLAGANYYPGLVKAGMPEQ
jgi:tetratricopeptide (TPR) repeat protein